MNFFDLDICHLRYIVEMKGDTRMIKVIKVIFSIVSFACGLFCVTGVIAFGSDGDWDWAIGTCVVAVIFLTAPFWKRMLVRAWKNANRDNKLADNMPPGQDDTVTYPCEEDPSTAGLLRPKQKRTPEPEAEKRETIEL